MHKTLREYGEFLVSIGKRHCYAESQVSETERLSIVQQEVLTGFMMQNDLISAKKLKMSIGDLPEILTQFAEYMISNSSAEDFLAFLRGRAVAAYYNNCQQYIAALWSEKCETKL